MAKTKKSTAIVPTMLRMREELRKRLEREAKKNERSLNSEMVLRLEQSFANEAQAQRESVIDVVLEALAPKGKDGGIDANEVAKQFADVIRRRREAAMKNSKIIPEGDSN